MKTSIVLAAGVLLVAFAAPAFAAEPPKFTASCPTGIEVKSNGKGKVRIGGSKAKVKAFNDTAWEARSENITVDISTGKDGSGLIVNYSVKNGGNGICKVTVKTGAAVDGSSPAGKAAL